MLIRGKRRCGTSSRSGEKYKGRVTNIADYGAFVELGDGVEGLVHVSEMSWTKKNIRHSRQDPLDQSGSGSSAWCSTSTLPSAASRWA